MARAKLTFRPDIERTRITFPETKAEGEKIVPLDRSGKGDLLIRPGETVLLTMDERDYLQKHHKDLLSQLLRFSVPSTVAPFQLEIPEHYGKDDKGKPKPVCRSRAGALHIRPNSTLEITADERDQLKRLSPSVFAQLRPLRAGRQLDAALKAKGTTIERLRTEKRNRAVAREDTEPPPTSTPSP